VVFFLQYRKRIADGFPALFEGSDSEGEDYSREGQFAAKYGWFSSLYALAQGDATKYRAVTEMNHLEALLFLEFEKEKTEIERIRYRRK